MDEESDRAAELIGAGSELVGATAGGALGLIGGPAGVAAGAAGGVVVTRVLKHIGAEVQQRWLGPRQRVRAGAAFASAIAEIGRRIDAGERLREDGFFDEGRSGRSSAEEILEGVLLHASQEYEERKVQYLGRLYASLAFRGDVGAAAANYLLRLANRLTYRQLVMLAIFDGPHEERAALGKMVSPRYPLVPRPAGEALNELDDLGARGLLGFAQRDGAVSAPSTTFGGGSFAAESFISIAPSSTATLLSQLCELSQIPASDKEEVFRTLHAPPATEPELTFTLPGDA